MHCVQQKCGIMCYLKENKKVELIYATRFNLEDIMIGVSMMAQETNLPPVVPVFRMGKSLGLVVPILIKLPARGLERQWRMTSLFGSLHTSGRPRANSWPPVLDWPSSGLSSYLRSNPVPVDGINLSLSLPPLLTVILPLKNKRLHREHFPTPSIPWVPLASPRLAGERMWEEQSAGHPSAPRPHPHL